MSAAAEPNPFEGIDVNQPDEQGFTALHKACLQGDWHTMSQLVKAGGDPRVKDAEGRDAQWFANLHLKASRAFAAREFRAARLNLYDVPDDLREMSDVAARELGIAIHSKTMDRLRSLAPHPAT